MLVAIGIAGMVTIIAGLIFEFGGRYLDHLDDDRWS